MNATATNTNFMTTTAMTATAMFVIGHFVSCHPVHQFMASKIFIITKNYIVLYYYVPSYVFISASFPRAPAISEQNMPMKVPKSVDCGNGGI